MKPKRTTKTKSERFGACFFAALLLTSLAIASAANAAIRVTPISLVPIGSETRVNTTTTDIQTINANVAQAVATDANGNFVVVWSSNLQDGAAYGIFAQRYNSEGVAQGAEFRVNTTTADSQILPAVAMDATGNFVVSWSSNLQDGSGYGVYGQRYNAAGVAQGAEFRVNTTTASSQIGAAIAMASNGAFVLTWSGGGQDPDASSGIYAQRFNAAGVAQGGEFRVNTYTTNTQQLSSVAMDAAGNFVVTWASNGQDGSGYGVYGQRYNAAGVAQGVEFRVNTTTPDSQLYNDVAMLADGRFVVEYQSRNGDGTFEVYLQRYATDGSTLGSETRVNTSTVSAAQQPIASIAADVNGNITVVWNSAADGSGVGVSGRRLDWSGTPLGAEFQVNTTSAGDQLYPEVVAQPGGGFIVAWGGNGSGDADGVFMQRYGLTTTETGGTATFSVVLEVAPTGNVIIPVSVSDATEGAVSVNSLTFTNLNWNTPQIVTATGVDDSFIDGNVPYTVVLGAASSTDTNYNGLNPADVSLTNNDDDTANTLIVDTISDAADGDTTSIVALMASKGADGKISLREAILATNATANGIGGPDRIHFNITGAGPHTINVLSALPNITQALSIDGTSEPDFAGTPVIEINGTSAGAGIDGLVLAAGSDGSTIRGLVINRFGRDGISGAANNVVIAGNYVGTNASGNADLGNGGDGIQADGNNWTIGGTTAADRNLVSGNDDDGVQLFGDGNTVLGNYIGTNAAGSAAIANTDDGIEVASTSSGNTIGGTAAGARNVVSGNGGEGILINITTGNLVLGNYVGIDAGGTLDLGNAASGVNIKAGANGNTIGGAAPGATNVISGNNTFGIWLDNGDSNTIQGNRIGTNAAGIAGIANSRQGIVIVNGSDGNLIGGTASGAGNLVAYNTFDGLAITGGTGNAILGNTFHSNGGTGIDLIDDGITANDGAKTSGQPNLLMDHPVFTTATLNIDMLTVAGYVGSAPNQSTFANSRVEIFGSDDDISGYGEGKTYIGYLTTDANGNFSGNLTVPVGDFTQITGTATDASNNTSEFGPNKSMIATAVGLLSLKATGAEGNALVSWTTAQEINNFGFHVYRSESVGGPYARITDRLIPGLSFSVRGREYSYVDRNVTQGRLYYYKLEDIDMDGTRTMHGPVCVDWDRDGIADDWEIKFGLNTSADDSGLDPDGDGLTNIQEILPVKPIHSG